MAQADSPLRLQVEELTVEIFGAEHAARGVVLMHAFGEEAAAVWRACERPVCLAAIPLADWQETLSPWPAEPAFRGGEAFGAGGEAHTRRLEQAVIPAVRSALGQAEAPLYLAGYSFAGLYALYALYLSPLFRGAVSASGSMWFPGFAEYAMTHTPQGDVRRVYLSLGDREARTRNPVLREVEERTLRVRDRLADLGIDCVFRLNPGNHFTDTDARLARGIDWVTGGDERPAPEV